MEQPGEVAFAEKPFVNVVKVLVLNEQNELLLLRRALHDAHRGGQVDFPGGSGDDGEPLEDAAIRELLEEIGQEAKREDLEKINVDWSDEERAELTKGSQLPGLELRRHYFLWRVTGRLAITTDPNEHSGGEWFARDAALEELAPKPGEPANARWYMRRVAEFVFKQEGVQA